MTKIIAHSEAKVLRLSPGKGNDAEHPVTSDNSEVVFNLTGWQQLGSNGFSCPWFIFLALRLVHLLDCLAKDLGRAWTRQDILKIYCCRIVAIQLNDY